MDTLRSKSSGNQLSKIIVKSVESRVNTVENDVVEEEFCFHYAFKPLYVVSRLIGLMPFSIVRGANGNILACKVTVFDFIWFFITIIWYFVLAADANKNLRPPPNPNQSLMINLGKQFY